MYKYCITRIIGNDLPPRHGLNHQINNLSFILENEFDFEDTVKIWIINRVIDSSLLAQLIEKLEKYNKPYFVIPFDITGYDQSWDKEKKVNFIIQINDARNFGILKTKEIAKKCALLDGGHFFNQEGWFKLLEESSKEEENLYKIDTYRVKEKNDEVFNFNIEKYRKDEEVIFFNTNYKVQFDTTKPYGKRDKIELLLRYPNVPKAGFCLRLHDYTHLGFIEWMRARDRDIAIDNLIKKVESKL